MKRVPPMPGVALGLFALTYGMLVWLFGPPTPLERDLAVVTSAIVRGDANEVRDYLQEFGAMAAVAAVAIMVVQALALPIPGFVILFANGLVFGVVGGAAVSLVGFALSASICFAITRQLGRRRIEWIAHRLHLTTVDAWLVRWGARGVFFLRLNPGFGFDGVSYAAGLTGMRYPPFLLASVMGSLPQTLLFVYLGERANEHLWWIMVIGMVFAILGLAAGFVLSRRKRAACSPEWSDTAAGGD